MKKLITILVCAFIVSSCDQQKEISNGQVPSELLPVVQKILGSYKGELNQDPQAQLNLHLDGNRLVLSGTDPIMADCHSVIGNLKSISLSSDANNPEVTGASFDLDSNLCPAAVTGKTINLSFAGNNMTTQILEQVENRQTCTVVVSPGNPPNVPPSSHEECRTDFINHYLTGKLSR